MHFWRTGTLLGTLILPLWLWAQTPGLRPQPPAAYGGNPSLTLDLRDPQGGTMGRTPVFDYVKFNPRFRNLAPLRRKCVTVEMEQDRKAKYGGESKEEFESWMERSSQYTRELIAKGAINSVYTLPVVVHVIYSNPTENISDAQVRSQIDVLNQDFRRRNIDASLTEEAFRKVAVDTEIGFCLASVDPQGRPTNGINRVSLAGAPFSDHYLNEVIKPGTIWDPKRYMNIWVCHLAGGVLGFAQFPSSSGLRGLPEDPGAGVTDGVVIHYRAFGTLGTVAAPFNQGRTTTHEVGHWLGLRHVWGDGPCDMDDFCDDTPSTSGPHFSCPSGQLACAGLAMVQNFMDYTDDACMNLFTQDQKIRMRTVIENSPRRRSLIDSDACRELILPPVADFRADVRYGCGPLTVHFKDLSQNHPKSYLWSFPGATPPLSTEPNPTVVFASPGTYTVSLKAHNDFGDSEVAIKEAYIRVEATPQPLPFALDFDAQSGPDPAVLLHPGPGWEPTARVGGKGQSTGAIWFNNFTHNQPGSINWLLTPVLDFSQARQSSLSFDVAYARYDDRYSDTLGVFINTSCGQEFKAIYLRGGQYLATSADQQQPFTPLPEAWRTEYLDLSEYDGYERVQLAFVNFSGYGNNVYIDNIRLAAQQSRGPKADFVAIERLVCPGDTVHFRNLSDPTATRLTWSFPGGIPAVDSGPAPSVRYPAPGNYEVVLTASGKGGSQTVKKQGVVQVRPGPPLQVNLSEAVICRGGSVTLWASGAESYQWYPQEGLDVALGPRVEAHPVLSTVYTVEGKGANGCTSRKAVEVEVREAGALTVSPASARICPGEGVLLSASGAERYRWEPSTGLTRTEGASVVAAPPATTTYTVTGTLGQGCTFSRQVTVEVMQAPRIWVKAEKEQICPGEPVRLRATGPAQPRWQTGDGSPALEGWEVVVAPTRTTTYTVTAADSGCQTSTRITLQVKPKPVIRSLQPEYIVCPGTQGELSVEGAQTFTWLPAEGLSITQGSTVPVNPRETFDYTVIGANTAGCTDTAVVRVTVPPAPDFRVANSHPTLCTGMKTTLSASGPYRFRWAPALGLNRTEGAEVEARPEAGVTYVVTATDSNGCMARQQVRVNVGGPVPPQAGFSLASRRVCADQPVQFIDRSRFATAYRWEFPGATPVQSSQQHPVVRYPQPGRYDVILRVVGCTGKDERIERGFVEVVPAGRLIVEDSFLTVCKGEPAILKASGMRSYRWSPRIGLNTYQGPEAEARPLRDITYTVTGIDANGCEDQTRIRLQVRGEADLVSVFASSPSVCAGQTVRLQAHGAEDFVWFDASGEFAGVGESLEVQPERTTTYRLDTRDRFGCLSSHPVRIEVKPRPAIDLIASRQAICAGDSVFLEARGGLQYQWPPQEGLIRSWGSQAVATPRETGIFRVMGTDGLGCQTEAQVQIRVSDGRSLKIEARDSVLCPGDSIRLSASGGTEYEWSPISHTDRIKGAEIWVFPPRTTTFVVKSMDDTGCPATGVITLRVAEPLALSVSPALQTLCPGDTVVLEAAGGSTYEWLPSEGLLQANGATAVVSPAHTTLYTVVARDAWGCEARGSATIAVNRGEGLQLAASSSVICDGETVTLRARGGQVLKWLPGSSLPQPDHDPQQMLFRPPGSALYQVVGRLPNGCLDTASIQVAVTSLKPQFSASTKLLDLAVSEGTVQFSDQSAGGVTSWNWDFGDGGSSEEQHPVHLFPQEGRYKVRLEVSNGSCTRQISDTLTVINSSDLEELLEDGQIRIFPHNGKITLEIISLRKMYLRYRLLNGQGKSLLSDVMAVPAGTYRQHLDLSIFPKDRYVLQISDGRETYSSMIE